MKSLLINLSFLLLISSFTSAQKHEFIFYTKGGDIEVYVNDQLHGSIDAGGKYIIKVKFDKNNTSYRLRLHKDGYEDKTYTFNAAPEKSATKLFWAMQKKRFRLSEQSKHTFDIARVKFDIDPNAQVITIPYRKTYWSSIGITESNIHIFEKGIHNELTTTGFKGLTNNKEEDNLFETHTAPQKKEKADISIGAIIRNLKIEGANYMFDPTLIYNLSVKMEVEWQFYDNSAEQLLLKTTTKESSFMVKETGQMMQGIIMAFNENFAAALNQPETITAITNVVSGTKKVSKENTVNPYTIANSTAQTFDSYSAMIKAVNPTVVTIKGHKAHGSGFVISEEGYILTNYHVIKNNGDVKIKFQMGFELPAKVLNFSEEHDLALLKVMGQGFTPLSVSAKPTEVGDAVVAIGTPNSTDLSNTVTKGIVSGLRNYDNGIELIQTDASVSPGNSGGPLINSNGAVVGIVSQKISGVSTEGIAFAIPIGMALDKLNINLQ